MPIDPLEVAHSLDNGNVRTKMLSIGCGGLAAETQLVRSFIRYEQKETQVKRCAIAAGREPERGGPVPTTRHIAACCP